jgi:hypothetical protein
VPARRRVARRRDQCNRIEVDVWTRIANHLATFPHPPVALTPGEVIGRALVSRRARRVMRRH